MNNNINPNNKKLRYVLIIEIIGFIPGKVTEIESKFSLFNIVLINNFKSV